LIPFTPDIEIEDSEVQVAQRRNPDADGGTKDGEQFVGPAVWRQFRIAAITFLMMEGF